MVEICLAQKAIAIDKAPGYGGFGNGGDQPFKGGFF